MGSAPAIDVLGFVLVNVESAETCGDDFVMGLDNVAMIHPFREDDGGFHAV